MAGRARRAWLCFLRSALLFTNSVLALVGMSALAFSLYAYREFRAAVGPPPSPQAPYPWFIAATAVTGSATCAAAGLGLAAALRPRTGVLHTYSAGLSAVLLGQLSAAVVVAADGGSKRWPPDPSGEAERLREWVAANSRLAAWLGVCLLAFQLFAVAVSCALTSAHQALGEEAEEGDSDSDDSAAAAERGAWRLRDPLLPPVQGAGMRADPWSRRMRDKYGLDPQALRYSPRDSNLAALTRPDAPGGRSASPAGTAACAVM